MGCIIGGAIGDALGGPYEGLSGPVLLDPDAPWHLSDDSQLTLATCEAVATSGAVCPAAIAERFADLYRRGRITGVGSSTLKALQDLSAGAHWALAGRKGERGAGNGAAMRVAPLAFCLDPEDPKQRTTLRDICRITHHNDEAYVGAVAVVLAVRAGIREGGYRDGGLPMFIAEALPHTMVKERLLAIGGLDVCTPLLEVARRFGCTGYVAHSVPLAIFAAQRVSRKGFLHVLREVIEAGGDTDTIASITGQIAGAWLGLSGLPGELVERLPKKGIVFEIAQRFAEILMMTER
jgi:ADP-ribosylglycohydrolase